MRFAMALVLLLLAPLALADARARPEGASGFAAKPAVRSEAAMVVTANPHATRIAAHVLRDGGTAADAAIAAAFALNVVEPQSSGIGGGGFLLHYDAASSHVIAWDGRESAPAAVDENLFRPEGQSMAFFDAVVGGRSVGVPGLARMLEAVHGEHGRLSWARLLQPAIDLAEGGFDVSPRLHALLARDRFLADDAAARALYYDAAGRPLGVGTRVRNAALARVFRAIARDGADVLHHGPIAHDIVAAVRAAPNPGLLSESDLATYRPVRREALCAPYRVMRVCGMPPPSAGGGAVLALLGVLERFDLAALDADSAFVAHLFAEAGRLAFADRDAWYGDPQAMPLSAAALIDPGYLARRAALISLSDTMGRARPGRPDTTKLPRAAVSPERAATSHVSIVDAESNAVSLTASIENAFGSRRMVHGFLLNNQLTDFSFEPRQADGTPHPNRVAPGRRPRSSMAPTLVFDGAGRLFAVSGAPGGSRIINYVAASIVAVVDWALAPDVTLARAHAGSRNGPTEVEDTPAGRRLARRLEAAFGHEVTLADMTSGLALIVRDGDGWVGAADPRREGVAEAVSP
ncbi:gamma-glutamyltransferase [Pseudazoarcus pumilus]|uniref:Gamma-glutamyltransferase n=2 Tax=Pseudazoarcus pumilus TaxID=2067960 RepID=A0A2I6SAT6_9RHOO|nr:gamma-glutamyltransferase [Pseudazoarcus pumilus]